LILGWTACQSANNPEEESTYDMPELSELSKAIEKTPEDPKLYALRAEIFTQYENHSGAIEDLKKALSLDSLNPQYYYRLSDSYMASYNSRQSLATLVKLASLYPEDQDVLLSLADLYLVFEMYDDSRNTVDRVLELNKNNAKAFFILGIGFLETGDSLRAKNAYLRAAELNPESLNTWMALGNLGIALEDKNSETYFKNALRLDSTNLEAMNSLGVHYQTLDRLEEAKQLYRKIILKDKRYLNAPFNLGLTYFQQDSFQKAIEHFTMALGIRTALPRAYYYRGLCYENTNKPDQALNDYQQSSIFDPNNEELKEAIRRVKNLKK
jgi:tetratricopeptide (TPR) repeat protein